MPPGSRQRELLRARRRAGRVGAAGFLAAIVLPAVLWHRTFAIIAEDFQLAPDHLVGYLPWALIAVGLLFLAPVAWSAGLDPASRFYPRARNAYAGWGLSLYFMGCALATQVAQMSESLIE